MPRSVNAVASRARRKKVLKLAKGNFGSRGNVWTVAKNTGEKGLTYAYRDRKNKKRQFRSLWIQRINAGVRAYGMTYSEFMGKVNAKGIALNRKVLADLAMNNPKAFEKVVKTVKSLQSRFFLERLFCLYFCMKIPGSFREPGISFFTRIYSNPGATRLFSLFCNTQRQKTDNRGTSVRQDQATCHRETKDPPPPQTIRDKGSRAENRPTLPPKATPPAGGV